MKTLKKRLNSSSIKDIGLRSGIVGLGEVECYFACMSYCNSACDAECAPKCNIGFDSFEAFYDQSNALGQTGYTANYWMNPC